MGADWRGSRKRTHGEAPVTCDKCGHTLEIGDFPFCPHPKGAQTVIGDDWPGGKIFENGFPEPRTFYSKSEHQKALAERGLEMRVKNAGPDDKIISRWDTVDLEAAAQLVQRGEQARRAKRNQYSDPFEGANTPIHVIDGEAFRQSMLDAIDERER